MSLLNAIDLHSKSVVFLWHAGANPEAVRDFVGEIQAKTGPQGHVNVENAERLKACKWNYSYTVQHNLIASRVVPLCDYTGLIDLAVG